jgi:hypothetical protein
MPEWTRDRVLALAVAAGTVEWVCDEWLFDDRRDADAAVFNPPAAVLDGSQDEALDEAVTALLDALGLTTIEIDYPGLQADLDELESTDPAVKAAAESYDRMVTELTRPIPGDGAA